MFRITAQTPSLQMSTVTVRHASPGDESALIRLAALDSARPPHGPALIAESDAHILAALPMGAGRPIADPFVPTEELVALLQLRASQLGERDAQAFPGLRHRMRALFGRHPVSRHA